jgi:hypothetical protein
MDNYNANTDYAPAEVSLSSETRWEAPAPVDAQETSGVDGVLESLGWQSSQGEPQRGTDAWFQAESMRDSQAEQRFDSEIDRYLASAKPGYPDLAREAVSGIAWRLLIDNKDAYGALRNSGNAGGVEQAVKQALKIVDNLYQAYVDHMSNQPVGSKPAAPGNRNLTQITADYLRDEAAELPLRVAPNRRQPRQQRMPPHTRSNHAPGTRTLEQIAAEQMAAYNRQLNGEDE